MDFQYKNSIYIKIFEECLKNVIMVINLFKL